MKKHFKKALSLLLTMAMILSCLSGLMSLSVSAAGFDAAAIKGAAKNYVAQSGNASTEAGLLAAVKAVQSNLTIDEYFIYHAVDGCYDEDPVPADRISIPGHDGYVSAVIKVDDDNYVGVICKIPHVEENLGVLTKISTKNADGSNNQTDFTIDGNSNLTAIKNKTAEKIIIDNNILHVNYSCPDDSTSFACQVLLFRQKQNGIIRADQSLGNSAPAPFRSYGDNSSLRGGWTNLKAVFFPDRLRWDYFKNSSFSYLQSNLFVRDYSLKYVHLPTVPIDASGNLYGSDFAITYQSFGYCHSLENINLEATGTLLGNVFKDTAILDVYYGKNTKNGDSANPDFSGTAYCKGTRTTLTYAEQQDVTFTRAAIFAQIAADSLPDDMTAQSALNAVTSSYSDKNEYIDASWTTPLVNTPAAVNGVITLDDGYGYTMDIEISRSRALKALNPQFPVSPAFDETVLNYTMTVANTVTSVSFNPTVAEGATLGTITGNTDLQVGANTVTIPVTTAGGSTVTYTVTITRKAASHIDEELVASIKQAAENYIAATGNYSTQNGLADAVKSVQSNLTIDEYFIYHAVDGCYDEDPVPEDRISIPGHDGYVSAVVKVDDDNYVGVIGKIPHVEENLGVLTKISTQNADGSYNTTDFEFNGDQLINIKNKTAEKIIVDRNVLHITFACPDNGTSYACKALVLRQKTNGILRGDSGPFRSYGDDNSLRSGFTNLKAVYCADDLRVDYFYLASNAYMQSNFFARDYALKYVHLPNNGSAYPIGYQAFGYCHSLENINLEATGTLLGNVFKDTAILDVYYGKSTKSADSGNPDFSGTAYCKGTRTTMTYEQQQTATFTRAAVLAQIAADALPNDMTAQSALNAVTNAYSDKNSNVVAEWTTPLVNAPSNLSGVITLSYNNYATDIEISRDRALTALNPQFAVSPAFDGSVLNYTMTVPNVVTSVSFNPTVAEGATLKTITGNTDLQVGENTVTVTVQNADGETVVYTITVIRIGVFSAEATAAAKLYVEEAGNEATAEGLLATVNTVLGNATLNDEDFFIKHAVPGAADNDTASGYPLNIPGSDGAVSAIFTYNGARYGFEASFGHEDEVIPVESFAIAGNSDYADYFEYDANGNIVNILKQVDKIILPEGYTGTVMYYTPVYDAQGNKQTPECLFNSDSIINADRVKVVIINNQVALQNKAFYNWNGLKAVQFADVPCKLFTDYNSRMQQFENCDSLKYVKLPSTITSSWGTHLSGLLFKDCTQLENINIPEFTASKAMSQEIFSCTNIRDFFLTQNITKNQDSSFENTIYKSLATGKVNRIYYTDDMTLARASSLIGAALYNANATTESDIIAIAKAAITGSHDAQTFVQNASFVWQENGSTDYVLNGNLTICYNGDDISIPVSLSKALYALSVDGYSLSQKFIANVTAYSIQIPYNASSVTVNAVPAQNASVTAVDSDISDNTISVTVDNTDGNSVVYNIAVERKFEISADALIYITKALLGIEGYSAIDVNKDGFFNLIDLVRIKKRLANLAEQALDSSEIMMITAEKSGVKSDDLISTLGYVSNGVVTDTMFSAVAFNISNSITHIYETDPQDETVTVTRIKPMDKRMWSELIHSYVFGEGCNVNALDEAAGEVAETLQRDNYKVKVYLPLLYPSTEMTNWGILNGETVNMSVSADRIAAQKWMIDEYIAEFNKHNYKNLVLAGFYRCQEYYIDGDDAFIPAVNAYVSGKNLESIWIPYCYANGYNNATVLGYFDRVNMQLNYFPGRDDLPNAYTDVEHIQVAIDYASANNMDGIQIELAARGKVQIEGFKEYLKAGVSNGLMSKENSWWIWEDSQTINYICNSDDAYIRSAYDEMYKFVKNTLTVAEINTNLGE